jgi:hypothetical protein
MDHNWGPRLQLFIDQRELIPAVSRSLSLELPREYRGFPVNFSGPAYDKTRRMEKISSGPVNHLIEVTALEDYLQDRCGISKTGGFDVRDWLGFTDQKLLEITAGEVFHDGLNQLNRLRRELAFYPPDICKLRLGVLWWYISNKEAFVGRSIALGDITGLKLIVSRIVNYLMKILFYYEGRYIPYSKWFGSAFKKLDAYTRAGGPVQDVLLENSMELIEEKLCALYEAAVEGNNRIQWLPPLTNRIRRYFGRPYRVIFAETIVETLRNSIADETIRAVNLRTWGHDIILDA